MSLLKLLKPKEPAYRKRSCVCQPSGITPLVPFQYIQNATVVLAPAAVDTGSALTSIAPPLKLAAWQVSGLGGAAGAARGLTAPVRTPLRPPTVSVTTPEPPHESFRL